MAPILPRPGGKRRRGGPAIVNHRVTDRGRTYRVCVTGGHVLFVALKCSAGGERMLKSDSRRERQIARLAGFPA